MSLTQKHSQDKMTFQVVENYLLEKILQVLFSGFIWKMSPNPGVKACFELRDFIRSLHYVQATWLFPMQCTVTERPAPFAQSTEVETGQRCQI